MRLALQKIWYRPELWLLGIAIAAFTLFFHWQVLIFSIDAIILWIAAIILIMRRQTPIVWESSPSANTVRLRVKQPRQWRNSTAVVEFHVHYV
jgi:hypothetical protein